MKFNLKPKLLNLFLNFFLFLFLMISIQNSSLKNKVKFFNYQTVRLPLSFILGSSFIFGSVMKKVLRHGYRKKRILWNFDFYSSHSSGFFIKKESQNLIPYDI